jgi:hypothetical protein
MSFDYSNILTRAGQITWKHKSIWGLLMLPVLTAFLPFILFFILFLVIIGIAEWDVSETMFVVLTIVFLLLFGLSAAVNYAVGSLFNSAATLGIVRAERGEGSTKFMDLLRDGAPYFWRILGLILVVNLTIGLIFTIFNLLAFVLILVTIGMASICLQPIMILLMPFMFLMVGVLEAAQIAIVVEGMSVMDAVKRALQVVRAHVWKYVIITLIVYFGSSILTSIFITPLMLPIFFVPFLLGLGHEISGQSVVLISVLFSCIFIPLMILISGVLGVFMKASLDITYLRLTSPAEK